MVKRKRKVKRHKQTPALSLGWINFRAKGAITIFDQECFDLLTAHQEAKAKEARDALQVFVDSLDLGQTKADTE